MPEMINNPSQILNSFGDAVIAIGRDGLLSFMNRAAEELIGYQAEEAVGQPCLRLVRCDACYEGCALERTVTRGEGIRDRETFLRSRDGRVIAVSATTFPLRDSEGTIQGAVQVFRKILRPSVTAGAMGPYSSFEKAIGKNHLMKKIYEALPEIARTKAAVLIEGESGTGKELIAHAIHQHSPRRDKTFIKVHCGAFAEGVLESELFGHVKGAFTGAIANKTGMCELADGGSLFLDEIGDINLSTQVKLLRVLQEEEFERVGDDRKVAVDVRIIAATKKDLKKAIVRGKFRQDLYDRLGAVPIFLPPLRERRDDIPLLIRHFMSLFNKEMGKDATTVSSKAMETLLNYDYPGNVRELENIIEHALVLCSGATILPEHLPKDILFKTFVDGEQMLRDAEDSLKTVGDEVERKLIAQTLVHTGWNCGETAKKLKIGRTTLWRKMREYGLKKP